MKKLLLLLLLPLFIFAQDSWVNIQFDFDGYADEVSWNLYSGTDSLPTAYGGDTTARKSCVVSARLINAF